MRLLLPLMTALMLVGIMGSNLASCKGANKSHQNTSWSVSDNIEFEYEDGDDEDGDTAYSVSSYEPPVIPSFGRKMLTCANWWADTVCVSGGKAFYSAYESFGRMMLLYNTDKVFVADPTLRIDSFASWCKNLFYVSVLGKTVFVDFSDPTSLRALGKLSQKHPSVTRFRHDTIAGFGKEVFYSLEVDFSRSSVTHSERIGCWLVDKIAASQFQEEYIPAFNAIYIGYAKRPTGGWTYKGDIHDHQRIARSAAGIYFASIKGEWGTDYEEYPSSLFSTQSLRARTFNERFVTYQSFTHEYNGGLHGFYTERLISFDHVHNREIDFYYLFKPYSEKEVLNLLLKEAQQTAQYQEWEPNIMDDVVDTDEDGNPTGSYTFPQPGLSEEGIVFSFQPYAISCFAAGTFHFTIPYAKIKHCLTETGKWCIGAEN